MNMEIKFRAWDAHNKEMINPYCKLEENNHFWGEDMTNTHYVSPVAVMQFTGLKDRHGKEIYVGDIIAWDYEYDSDYDGDMPIVKRSTGRAAIEDIFDRARILDAASESKGCEVIGNIYEHPELLTK